MESILIATVNGRQDKNDLLLKELVDAKNWKQALANCEKRFRKGDKSDGFLVNKAHILLRTPDKLRQEQGATELNAILGRNPPITDIRILLAVDEAAEARHAQGDRIASMWDKAASEAPANEDLYMMWFKRKFERRDYKAAQKAAMMYQKNFPKERHPFFLAIVSSHLAGVSPKASETDRKLFTPLAYRLLSKSATDAVDYETSPEKDPSKYVRALQCTGDVQLLVAIYKSQGRYAEAIAALDDPHIGLGSRICGRSWDLVREQIELYTLCESWENLWRFCQDILVDARRDSLHDAAYSPRFAYGAFGDDWKIWSGLMTASVQIATAENVESTVDLCESYLAQTTPSRNGHLALMAYRSLCHVPSDDANDKFRISCRDYFRQYCPKPVCFDDMYPHVHNLPVSQQAALLSEISEHTVELQRPEEEDEMSRIRWITAEINALKMDYSLVVSRQDNLEDTLLLQAFISNCLRLYRISLTVGSSLPVSERRPGDDAAILAAIGCIHLLDNGYTEAILRCAAILELLLSHSKHNYTALLMIVRVYLYVGAGSKAAEHYAKLDIKHIQNQTISWILFTRISTIHPQLSIDKARSDQALWNPATGLSNVLKWINKSQVQMKSGISKFLDNESFVNLLDYIPYMEKSEASLSKYSIICESLRISRFTGKVEDINYESSLGQVNHGVHDIRDTTAFPNYEAYGQVRFEEMICPGPMPGKRWLAAQLRTLRLVALLGRQTLDPDFVSDRTLNKLEKGNVDDMTVQEHNANHVVLGLTLLICFMVNNGSSMAHDFIRTMMIVEGCMTRNTEVAAEPFAKGSTIQLFPLTSDLEVPDWQFFHAVFVLLDICRLMSWTVENVAQKNRIARKVEQKWIDTKAAWCRARTKEVYSHLHRTASKLQARLDQPETMKELTDVCFAHSEDDEIGEELQKLMGRSTMEKWNKELIRSWKHALDGVTRTTFS